MAKTRPPYTPEFRRQMVELVRVGRSFEPTAQSIRNWVGQAECDAGRRGNAPGERVQMVATSRTRYRSALRRYADTSQFRPAVPDNCRCGALLRDDNAYRRFCAIAASVDGFGAGCAAQKSGLSAAGM
jgi:transposase-like protein